ncbi:hypothetical protein MRB53_040067 [Persea americana]|nr:hypothetical protein MRB53_040067 [Persea americana]
MRNESWRRQRRRNCVLCSNNKMQKKARHEHQKSRQDKHEEPPTKRRRLSDDTTENQSKTHEYRLTIPERQAARSVAHFQHLNPIEEGSYGFVSRARETATGEIVALKKLKLDPLRDGGFPVTALREIQCLTTAKHRHIVDLREIVVGEGSDVSDVFLVMEFLEHDLKSLQEDMQDPFTPSEVKTLMLQLGSAVEFLHDHWILHRDLKTSNILMSNQLLLGATAYDSAIDIWSIGCIFGELLLKTPILQGKNEIDQVTKSSPQSNLEARFSNLSEEGTSLLRSLLNLDPDKRTTAKQMLSQPYFNELPRAKPTAMWPTFPSKAGQEKRRRLASPHAPVRINGQGAEFNDMGLTK